MSICETDDTKNMINKFEKLTNIFEEEFNENTIKNFKKYFR